MAIVVSSLLVAVLIGTFAYAALVVTYNITTNTVTIGGIGVTVNWLTESNNVGALTTSTQFGTVISTAAIAMNPADTAQNCIVFTPNCNGANEAITWTTTLSPTVGTLSLTQTVYSGSWNTQPLAQGFILSGTSPYGIAPTSSFTTGELGCIQLVFTPAANAVSGSYSFSITFTGTQQ